MCCRCLKTAFYVIMFTCLTTVVAECPPNWTRSDHGCFHKVVTRDKVDWSEAKERCENDYKAELARIDSKEQSDTLDNLLNHVESWIGLKANANSSLKGVNGEKPKFLPNSLNRNYSRPTCVAIRRMRILEENKCDKSYNYTCEKLQKPGQCETFNKTCYTISQKKSNFSSSLLSCESKQESIIEISKKAEYNFIKQEFGGRNLDVWLGVVKPINSSSYQYLKGNKSADLSELDDEFKVKAKLSERFCITIKITKNLNFIEKQCDFRLSSYVCYKKMKQATAIELMILKNISSKIVQAQAGETVNLRCAATGMSNMKFSWSKDGRGLENVLETYEGNQSTIVSVTIRNNKDFGKYKCTIKDGFSERNLTIWVENWSEGGSNDDKVLLTVTITLTVFVVILIAIIFCCFKHNKQLKRSLKRSNDSGVEMTNASNDRREEQTTKGYEDGTIGNEMSQYTSLRRENGELEEDNFYSPLQEAPQYVNVSEIKNSI